MGPGSGPRRFFFAEGNVRDAYVVAGSFTGFVIDHCGWDSYGRLFRKARRFRFQATFAECCGVPFAEAERRWRDWLEGVACSGRGQGKGLTG